MAPSINSAFGGEGERVSGAETQRLDLDVGGVEADPSGKFCISRGGLSESTVIAEAYGVDGVVRGDETEVVLAS